MSKQTPLQKWIDQQIQDRFTYREVGEMLGITGQYAQLLKTGARKPGRSLIPKIARVTGIEIAELL